VRIAAAPTLPSCADLSVYMMMSVSASQMCAMVSSGVVLISVQKGGCTLG
jgi:hypothetical protein